MSAHLALGGRAVYMQHGGRGGSAEYLVLAEGSSETKLMQAGEIPATQGGLVPFRE